MPPEMAAKVIIICDSPLARFSGISAKIKQNNPATAAPQKASEQIRLVHHLPLCSLISVDALCFVDSI